MEDACDFLCPNEIVMSPQIPQLTLPQQLLAGGAGSLLTCVVVNPLDVIKTRLQMLTSSSINPWSHIQGVVRKEGLRVLANGLSVSMLMTVPSTAIYLAVYERIRQRLEHSGRSSVVSVMIAGSVGRTVAVVVSSPFEYIRTVMQAHHPTQGVNMIRDAIAMRGMGTLWLGLVPTLLRDVPFSIIYWGGYEYGARTLQPWFASRPLHDSSLVHVPSMARNFVAGAASGMVAAAFTTPFDVVKTRRQVASQTTASTHDLRLTAIIKQIFRDEGVAGFTHGLIPRVIRVTPACAIMITSYELFKTHFMRHNNGHRD